MTHIPDLTDPRYLDEVGWFLYHEKYGRDKFGGSYAAERLEYSRLLLEEVLDYLGRDKKWIEDKTILSVGSGCTGDLAAFPAAVKIAADPLLNVYHNLGMLLEDKAGGRTMCLSIGAENLPLLDGYADLVLCRNALDHMPDPEKALGEFWRILKRDGLLFVSVDLGGEPTPDEPTVFSVESLRILLGRYFEITRLNDTEAPHSAGRVCSVRLIAQKKSRENSRPDKEAILRAYEARLADEAAAAAPKRPA